MKHGAGNGDEGMAVPVLDSGDGEPVTWRVLVLGYRSNPMGATTPGLAFEEVTAAEVVVIGGALVFRDGGGGLVQAYGPSSWHGVERKPTEEGA